MKFSRQLEIFLPHKIGEGGFGTVYKGKLKNGWPVAIKHAKKDSRVLAEFKSEVQALSKIEHLNLVRFYGFLELRDERIIVTEYVSNGTLREHLDVFYGVLDEALPLLQSCLRKLLNSEDTV